jgi:hypothetical protein
VSARRLFAAVHAKVRSAAFALAAGSVLFGFGAMSAANGKPVTVSDLLAGSPATDWRTPNPDDILYLELPRGRVVIELASRVAPSHVANVKRLVRARYFDGLAIIRVQDNYVVQWDDADHRRPIPVGVRPSVELIADARAASRFEPLPDRDLYAAEVGFLDGFPAARDPATHTAWEPPVSIASLRLASDVPAAERTPIEVLRTESATFRAVLAQRRDRHEPWFKFNPGHIDLCNVPLPVRTPGRP